MKIRVLSREHARLLRDQNKQVFVRHVELAKERARTWPKLREELDKVQKGCSVRLFMESAAEQAALASADTLDGWNMPAAQRKGCFVVVTAGPMPGRNAKWAANSTRIIVTCTGGDNWFVTDIRRVRVHHNTRDEVIHLTPAAAEHIQMEALKPFEIIREE